jgi:hypothetical protein
MILHFLSDILDGIGVIVIIISRDKVYEHNLTHCVTAKNLQKDRTLTRTQPALRTAQESKLK